MTETPKLLNHYTTAQGLIGILKSNVLWASNLYYMNDFSELRYSTNLIESELDRAIKSSLKDSSESGPPKSLANLFAKLEGSYSVYASCFCKDEDKLSQWRAYSEKGTGYCIGFAAKQLKQSQKIGSYTLFLKNVIYDRKIQEKQIRVFVSKFVSEIRDNKIAVDPFRVFMAEAFEAACSFKNPAFSQEKEWRVIALNLETDNVDALHFREVQGTVVPYIEMRFPTLEPDKKDHLPIVEIIQGPLVDPALGEKSLKLLLKKYGYDNVEVRRSKVPIRF
jgi:hypothetical protein